MFFKSKKHAQPSVPAIVPALPDRVPMRTLLRPGFDPDGWRRLDIGLDPGKQAEGIADRRFDPHTLVIGSPGSGKTCVLRMIAVQALSRGHEVIAIDPAKGLVDYLELKPWLKETAHDEGQAADLVERVCHEMKRRFQAMRAHDARIWFDLPDTVREQEQIRPLTVIVDELPEFRPSEASAKLRVYLGSIIKQGRAAGIHIVVGTQRPHPEILGSLLLALLGSNIVLTVSPNQVPEGYTLRSISPAFREKAAGLARRWNDNARGFAVVSNAHSGTVSAVRIGYAHWDDIPAILVDLKVPHATPGFPDYTLLRDDDDL